MVISGNAKVLVELAGVKKMSEEKERILKLIIDWDKADEQEDPGVDYAAEYKKQTGRDLETGEYVTQ